MVKINKFFEEQYAQNITPLLSEEELTQIANDCIEGFNTDQIDFSERQSKIEELYNLCLQKPDEETKDYPFPNASNQVYPLLTQASIDFNSIAFPSLIKDNMVVKAVVVGDDEGGDVFKVAGEPLKDESGEDLREEAGLKQKRADRVATYMNYQLLKEMRWWQEEMDKILLIIPIVGCCFRKVYHNAVIRQNVSTLVLPQNLVIENKAKSLDSANRITEEFTLSKTEVEEHVRAGVFSKIQDDYEIKEDKKEVENYTFLEQHTYFDLDQDGLPEPYIVWICKDTEKVVRILPRFHEDSIVYRERLVTKEVEGIEQEETQRERKILRIKPHNYYVKYSFIPDPTGSIYDIGLGDLVYNLNKGVNTTLNQLIDAGHRQVAGGGFIDSAIKMLKGKRTYRPNEFIAVNAAGSSIREGIVPFPNPEPSGVLFSLLQFLVQGTKDIASSAKVSSDLPSNAPATTTLAYIEQSMQPFKAVFKRIYRALENEAVILYELNNRYLLEEDYKQVLDSEFASMADFDNIKNSGIIPIADPEMVSNTQQFMRAQIISEYKDDPYIDGLEARKAIMSLLKISDADSLFKEPQEPQPDPLQEMQMQLLQAQIAKTNAELAQIQANTNKTTTETAIKVEKAPAEIESILAERTKKDAEAVNELAIAEEKEVGEDLPKYINALDQIIKVAGQ